MMLALIGLLCCLGLLWRWLKQRDRREQQEFERKIKQKKEAEDGPKVTELEWLEAEEREWLERERIEQERIEKEKVEQEIQEILRAEQERKNQEDEEKDFQEWCKRLGKDMAEPEVLAAIEQSLTVPVEGLLHGLATCAICQDPCVEPRSLPCFHSFCSRCLDGLIAKTERHACPTCRTAFSATAALPTLAFIQNVVEEVTSSEDVNNLQCGVCEGSEAACYCNECDQYLCATCQSLHLKMRTSANHTFTTLEAATQMGRGQKMLCPQHPTLDLDLYCEDCHEVVCARCAVLHHANHPSGELTEEIASKLKNSLTGALVKIREKETKVEEGIRLVTEAFAVLEGNQRQTEQDLEKSFGQLLEALHLRYAVLLGEVEQKSGAMRKELQLQKESHEFSLAALQQLNRFATGLVAEGTKVEVGTSTKGVLRRSKTLLEEAITTKPVREGMIHFSPDLVKDIMPRVTKLGTIHTPDSS